MTIVFHCGQNMMFYFFKSILSSNSLLHDVFCMRLMLYNDNDTLLKMAFDTVGNVLQFVSLKS